MPANMIIIKRDGTQTAPPMAQAQAEVYLGKLIYANRTASLKQALNQAFDGDGKPTGDYKYGFNDVLHASSGDGQQSVALFYYVFGNTIYLFAMGEHLDVPKPQVRYKLSDYGQPNGQYVEDATIILR
jgi:hypothetical protein